MKRKNKRHDSKGSPEKSPEKPSRRSNRHSKRRRKSSSSSSSPERREKVVSKSKDAAVVKNNTASKSSEKVRSYTPELVTEKVNKEKLVVEKNVEHEAGSSRRSSKRHSGNEQAETGDKVALVKKDEGGGGDDNEWKEDKSFWEGDEKVNSLILNKFCYILLHVVILLACSVAVLAFVDDCCGG